VAIPAGVKVEIKGTRINISGADKQAVGQLAAEIRQQRPPEPYNGKGIKYSDERINRKSGKAMASGA
jgi:large subunit ribosomal protein L6